MKQLSNSEIIVNSDASIYHLRLRPEHVFDKVITVGDPDRVSSVANYLDHQYFSIENREFKTIGGSLNGQDITILSTGIGTDNIDIVLNELAFLLNYDLKTRISNEKRRSIDLIRLGTSGSVSAKHPLESIVYSKSAISFEDLFQYYHHNFDTIHFDKRDFPVISCSQKLEHLFACYAPSLTLTAKGFYGPQFRNAQLPPKYTLADIESLHYLGEPIGNIEMETAGIYGLASLLGFEAISINALLADRRTGEFSKNASQVIDKMISESLAILCP